MKKIFYLATLATFLSAEPSAFLAGDLDSPNPYGLTKDEKYIWQNRQDIKKLKKLVKSQQQIIKKQSSDLNKIKLQFLNYKMKVDNLTQQLNGINTILPLIDKMNMQMSSFKKDLNSTNSIVLDLQTELSNLKSEVKTNKVATNKHIDDIINLVEQLAKNLDNIQKSKSDFKKLSNAQIFSKALFYMKKGKFKQAREMFEYLYAKKYRPATTLFYLGEIRYKQGYYKIALAYYKKSIQTYPKPASFTPELLYHTGYSFERLGNIKAAKQSYQKIINDFPKSIFVKYAKKRLQKISSK